MRALLLSILLAISLAIPACKSIECAPGTIERNGTCQPADETTGTAKCGPFTVLQGDQCAPQFPPTICDPATTTPNVDPATGVTTCIGTGAASCSGAFACPTPASGKQTVCGQLYNFADNTKFAAANATGVQCTAATTTGPCALQMAAFDAVNYLSAPTTTAPQATGAIYIDDCGRYRIPDITPPAGPVIAIGLDDAGMPFGPSGVTVTTSIALPTQADTKTANVEAWIVDVTTVGTWQATGGPMLANGIYAAIFRTHTCDATGTCTGDAFANQSGVTITENSAPKAANDSYFAAEAGRLHIDAAANLTSIDGTALYTPASLAAAYSGSGGLSDNANCVWETHAAGTVPGAVFMQVYRPTSKPSKTCTQ
jgi:hypothetical protein